jgi:hypothetical protein
MDWGDGFWDFLGLVLSTVNSGPKQKEVAFIFC